jgi:carbamoyltransferase
MGDGGLAAGAAWLAWAASPTGNVTSIPARLEHVYLGPDIDERHAGDAFHKQGLTPYRPDNMADAVAQRLAVNKIVARAAGAMEYGPRALGNRSILYSATDASVNKWLNKQLRRTEFMPFAPVCQDVDATQFFKNLGPTTAYSAEFMTVTYDVTSRCAAEAPAVVHIDGTARPQIVRRNVNADYYDILTQYKCRTGQSLLVNTSFNMHEEPIVCTATEAITAFFESDVDSLVLGPFMLDNPLRSQQGE